MSYTNLDSFRLNDYKDKIIDPIVSFMDGPKKVQLDEARGLLQDNKSSLTYLEKGDVNAIEEAITDPNIFKGTAIQTLVSNTKALRSKLDSLIENERSDAELNIEELKNKMLGYEGYSTLNEEQTAEIEQAFDSIEQLIKNESLIAVVRERTFNFEKKTYPDLLQKVINWNRPSPQLPDEEVIIGAHDLNVNFAKPILETEADVEMYVEKYKSALLETVKKGTKVSI